MAIYKQMLKKKKILAKLAVKPLSRFKCVSKSWLSLIDSKSFINKHLRNSQRDRSSLIDRNSMIFFNKHSKKRSVIFKFNSSSTARDLFSLRWRFPKPATGTILGCFNGVLCYLKQDGFFFTNPAIKISNELPKLGLFYPPYLHGFQGLRVRALMNQKIRCGFGWDEETDAYKVFVSIIDSRRGRVYSSKTNMWKTVECGEMLPHRTIGPYYNVGVFAYGKIHWISESDEHSRIEYFDLKSEVFGVVDLPSQPQPRGGGVWSLRESRGCLYALYRANNAGVGSLDDDVDVNLDRLFDVWVMEIYGVKESWVKKCSIPISYDKIEYPNSYNVDDAVNIAPYSQQHYVYVESLVSPICDIKGYRG